MIALVMLLTGCAQQYFFNHALSFRNQTVHYNYDLETCRNIAAANVKIPPIRIEYNGPRYVYGTADIRGDGISTRVNYSGYVYEVPNFNSGFAQGWQIGSAIGAAARRGDKTDDCMAKSGWVQVPEIYTPRHGNRQIPENASILEFASSGFQDLFVANGELFLWNPKNSFAHDDQHWQIQMAQVLSDNRTFVCTHRIPFKNERLTDVMCNDLSTATYVINDTSVLSKYLAMLKARGR